MSLKDEIDKRANQTTEELQRELRDLTRLDSYTPYARLLTEDTPVVSQRRQACWWVLTDRGETPCFSLKGRPNNCQGVKMEINMDPILGTELSDLCGSQMEHGPSAATVTWNNCLEAARTWGRQLCRRSTCPSDPELFYALAREHFIAYGAWSRQNVNSWSRAEVRAALIQDTAAALRELESARECYYLTDEELTSGGYISGRLWVERDGAGDVVSVTFYAGG